MPSCSQCGQDKERSEFAKAQLKKLSDNRRCKDCVSAQEDQKCSGNEGKKQQSKQQQKKKRASHLQPPPIAPLSSTHQVAVQNLIDVAVPKILQRGIAQNVGLDGMGHKELAIRLWNVANNDYILAWLTVPFLVGLIKGGEHINKRVSCQGSEAWPILHWLCQYKLMRAQLNYIGNDDMIALALAAGADVTLTAQNKCTALFFSLKYSSARAVQMLLDAGSKIDQRDHYGQTIWKNAVERPDPKVIELLIERCNSLIPVTGEKLTAQQSGVDVTLSLPDHMLGIYSSMFSSVEHPNSIPLSWQILGVPKIDDMAISLVRVLQAGARFSSSKEGLPDGVDYTDPLSLVTHIDSPMLQASSYTQQQIDIIRSLRDVIYGRWLPETIRREVKVVDQSRAPDTTCVICLTDMEPSDNPVTLYCGHRFCVKCIKAYGKGPNEQQIRRGSDKRCPTCRRLLCGDLLTNEHNKIYRTHRYSLGIDRHDATEQLSFDRGPHLLTDEQLRVECDAILGKTEGTREELLKELKAAMQQYSTMT
jgi:hypothetical protein